MDEACRYPRNNDSTFLQKLITNHTRARSGQHRQIVDRDKTLSSEDLTFVIKNSYGETTYDTHGFLEKNKGHLGPHIVDVVIESTYTDLVDLFDFTKDGKPTLYKTSSSVSSDHGSHQESAAAASKHHLTVAKKMIDDLNQVSERSGEVDEDENTKQYSPPLTFFSHSTQFVFIRTFFARLSSSKRSTSAR